MKLHEKYNLEYKKYSKLDRNLYSIEIFIVCINGCVYKGNFDEIYINDNDTVSYIGKQGIYRISPEQINHITYTEPYLIDDATNNDT